MSSKELTRLEVMQRLKDKRLVQKEAAEQLGLSVRQVKRLWQKYKKQAAKGLISQRRGKASNHRLEAEVVQQALDLIKKKYSDFGPTLAHEKLQEVRSGSDLARECAEDHDRGRDVEAQTQEEGGGTPDARATGLFWGTDPDRWF
ncbi:MAG: helix-turn-helix domain-containing protein [Candidatus Moduliflexus flocculans]|nr:helix-turn-helix domain-containing protein [Candidatus Moduliflexus flocculans]